MSKTSQRGVDHIGVVVCAIVHDGRGKILLMKRGKGARDEHGCWDICAGALEFGESVDEAIEREMMEELITKPLDTVFLTVGDAHRVNYEGQKTHWVYLLHAVRVDPKTAKLGEPHKFDEIGWFNLKTLPSPMHSQFSKILKPAKEAGIIK